MHKDKLTVILNVQINESVAIQRIRKYFSEANYEELHDKMPTMKFRRYTKKSAIFSSKGGFLGGTANLDMNDRYSFARLVIIPLGHSVNIKVSFEEINLPPENYFTQEILQKEIESLHEALSENVYKPITMDRPQRKYILSYLKSFLILLTGLILFLGIFFGLLSLSTPDTTRIELMIEMVFSMIVVIGLDLLYRLWYRKRSEGKVISNINKKNTRSALSSQ